MMLQRNESQEEIIPLDTLLQDVDGVRKCSKELQETQKSEKKHTDWLKFYYFAMFRNISGAVLLLVSIVTASIQLYERIYLESYYEYVKSEMCPGKDCMRLERVLAYSEPIMVAIVVVVLALLGYVLDLT